MALEYKSQIGLDAIMPVLDEYVVWYGKLMKAYFEGVPAKESAPVVFTEWLLKAEAGNNIDDLMAERLKRIHEGMVQAAVLFAAKFASRENPPLREYDELSRHYEEFIQMMRRLELDHATENSGFDDKTGLRSIKLMKEDISREMERRARRGNPFSLAVVKINNFKEEWRKNEEGTRVMIRKISDKIKESLRSFDDAYYLGNEYFLLSLKHADMLGSQAAVSRLNQGITSAHIPMLDDPIAEISVSTVVSEPTQGDSLDGLLTNMKKDLEGIDTKGTVLQYNDVSPLQRYLHSIGKDK
jgi:diguanylate cyclase